MEPGQVGSYPAVRRRLALVSLRLAARAASRALWLGGTAGERLLLAFLLAAGAALAVLLLFIWLGVPSGVGMPISAITFGAVFGVGALLGTGPPDRILVATRAALRAELPAAKAEREAERERRRAEREAETSRAAPVIEAAPPPAPLPAEPLVPLSAAFTPPPGDWLAGDGTFPLAAVGESYHRKALEEIASGLTWLGDDRTTPGVLRLDDNPHDRYAVAVLVGGRKVGQLARADAKAFRLRVAGEGRVGPEFPCRAKVDLDPVTVRLDVRLYA